MSGRIAYKKVLGEKNPADLLTKYMPADLMKRHLSTINARPTAGRAVSAPQIDSFHDSEDDKVEFWVQIWGEKRVTFNDTVFVRPIPADGRGLSCTSASRWTRRTRWASKAEAADIVAGAEIIDERNEK